MISFVVIGRNEGEKIKNCLGTVFETITFNKLQAYEVVYVDSDSNDNSLELVNKFEEVKVVLLKGELNAAIARNEGANQCNGEILFFIDGDMEIIPTFLPLALKSETELIYDFISGDFLHIEKSEKGVINKKHHNLETDIYMSTTGGIFLIYRTLWEKVGGMKPKYRRSQDIDLGLRLSKLGYEQLRKKELIAKHFTIYYTSSNRLWQDIIKGNQLYQKSMIYRDHFFHKDVLKMMLKEVTFFYLIFAIWFSFALANPFILLSYLGVISLKIVHKRKNWPSRNYLEAVLFYATRDVIVVLGFFFFWPSNSKKYTVQVIN